MAWRPNEYVIEGMLSNTEPNKITGHITFAGIGKVIFNLKGNFHRDIRGAAIKFVGDCGNDVNIEQAKQYLQGFALKQTGKAGDITAGREPVDYVKYPYYAQLNIMCSSSNNPHWRCSLHDTTPHNLH